MFRSATSRVLLAAVLFHMADCTMTYVAISSHMVQEINPLAVLVISLVGPAGVFLHKVLLLVSALAVVLFLSRLRSSVGLTGSAILLVGGILPVLWNLVMIGVVAL